MTIRICAVITAETIKEAVKMAEIAEKSGADILELRSDYLKESGQLSDIVKSTSLPMILTLRRHDEGGRFTGSEKERIQTILKAAEDDFKYVDIELTAPSLTTLIEELEDTDLKTIISHHDLVATPSPTEMASTIKKEIQAGADICKIVTTANIIQDNLTCLNLVSEISKQHGVICFAMGKLGVASRVFSPLFGAYLTFASAIKGRESAPGQLTVKEMRQIYELLGV